MKILPNHESVLEHGYPGLWVGAVCCWLLGGLILVLALLLTPMPDKMVPLTIGGTLISLGFLFRWLVSHWRERIEIDEEAITWIRGGRLRLRLPLNEIQHIRFNDWGSMVIEDRDSKTVMKIPMQYENFAVFLERLKSVVPFPWVSLVGPRSSSESHTSARQLFATPQPAGSLPLVHREWGRFSMFVIGSICLIALTLCLWFIPSFLAPSPSAGRTYRKQQEKREVMKYISLALALACSVGTCTIWITFQVDETGVQLRYLFSSRRFAWAELLSVDVKTSLQHYKRYMLVITPKARRAFEVPLGNQAYVFCDTILFVASQAGMALKPQDTRELPNDTASFSGQQNPRNPQEDVLPLEPRSSFTSTPVRDVSDTRQQSTNNPAEDPRDQ